MIDPNIEELLNTEIDGKLTADERVVLHRTLEEDPEARNYQKELHGLARVLSSVRPVDPPRHLANRIRASVHANDASPVSAATTWRDSLRSLIHPASARRHLFVLAWTFVACVCVYLVAANQGGSGTGGDAQLVGSFVLTGEASGFANGEHIDVDAGTIRGTIETRFRSGYCLFRMNLASPEAVMARIQTDPSAVEVKALRPTENSGTELTVRGGEIALGGLKGGKIGILFGKKEDHLSPVHLKLLSSGRVVFDREIVLEQVN
jgi:hypothetical protein